MDVTFSILGDENYEQFQMYAKEVFQELEHIGQNGLMVEGLLHEIEISCCCDWKVAACIPYQKGNMTKVRQILHL